MVHTAKRRALHFSVLMALGLFLLASYAFLLGVVPETNIVKEFNLSYAAAA